MRRKPGTLLEIELSILEAAVELRERGANAFHGFLIAKHIKDKQDAKLLTAYGTLYKALGRLEKSGMLSSIWEDPEIAATANRPRRRLYETTAAGERALAEVRAAERQHGLAPEPGQAMT